MLTSSNSQTAALFRSSALKRMQFVVLAIVLPMLATQNAGAQTEVTRYLVINNGVIPYKTLTAPNTPQSISAVAAVPYRADVSWSVSVDANHYQLELLNSITSQWQIIYDGPASLFTATNLPAGVRSFRVTACGGNYCSDESATALVTIALQYDIDSDGVPDYADLCPNTAYGKSVDADGCSITQRDTDGDGINDHLDLCADTPTGTTVSAAGCVPTTVDTDGDGVTDDIDYCANTLSTDTADSRGCAPDQIDSDNDGTSDYLDSYPHQHDTLCTG